MGANGPAGDDQITVLPNTLATVSPLRKPVTVPVKSGFGKPR